VPALKHGKTLDPGSLPDGSPSLEGETPGINTGFM